MVPPICCTVLGRHKARRNGGRRQPDLGGDELVPVTGVELDGFKPGSAYRATCIPNIRARKPRRSRDLPPGGGGLGACCLGRSRRPTSPASRLDVGLWRISRLRHGTSPPGASMDVGQQADVKCGNNQLSNSGYYGSPTSYWNGGVAGKIKVQ